MIGQVKLNFFHYYLGISQSRLPLEQRKNLCCLKRDQKSANGLAGHKENKKSEMAVWPITQPNDEVADWVLDP